MPDYVAEIIIATVMQMQDEERKPELLAAREKYGCKELTNEDAKFIVSRIKDCVDEGIGIHLNPNGVKSLFAYMLNVETQHELDAMNRRGSNRMGW